MNDRQATRMMGVFTALGVVGLAACSAADPAGRAAAEKVATTAQALVQNNPTKPYTFPYANPVAPTGALEFDCGAKVPRGALLPSSGPDSPAWAYSENYVAYPVNDKSDSYATAYSHYYAYEECSAGSLNCQLASDFFGIPSANGYKYQVAQLTQVNRAITQSTKHWFLEGIARVDTPWSMQPPASATNPPTTISNPPWCTVGGCVPGTSYFDSNSHPSYGTNEMQGDWLALWNLAWTYSYVGQQDGPVEGPHNPPNVPNTRFIESTHHQCAFIYACPGGIRECAQDSDCPSGQYCAPDINDPGMTCWASCYDYQTGTFDADPHALVPIDFFVAAEKHDPGGTDW